MSRITATAIRFTITLLLLTVLGYLILFVWYPDFFRIIDGGWRGLALIIGVDLVMGPLLTAIVYAPGKDGLKSDMLIIGALQAICLAAGITIVYQERPLTFIYYDKYFYSASADTYARYGRPLPSLAETGVEKPAFVTAAVPEDPIEKADTLNAIYDDEMPVWVISSLYQPMDKQMNEIMENAFDIAHLRELDKGNLLDTWVNKQGGTIDDYAFFPLHSRYRPNMFIAIRRSDQTFVESLPIEAPLYNN